MNENASNTTEVAEQPDRATDRTNNRKIAARISREQVKAIPENLLFENMEAIMRGDIPADIMQRFEGAFDGFITNHRALFGYPPTGTIPPAFRDEIKAQLNDFSDIFESDVFDRTRWQAQRYDKLVTSTRARIRKNFGADADLIPDEAFSNRTLNDLEKLVNNSGKQASLLAMYSEDAVTQRVPKELENAIKKLGYYLGEDDKDIKKAYDELSNFKSFTTDHISADVFQVLLDRDILSDQEVKEMAEWLMPTVPIRSLHQIGIHVPDIPGYSTPSAIDEDTNTSKTELFRTTVQSVNIEDLPLSAKKALLTTYGSKKLVQQIHDMADGPNLHTHASFYDEVSRGLGYAEDDYSYRTQDGFKDALQRWNIQKNAEVVENVSKLGDNAIIERQVQDTKGRPMTGYFRVVEFPDGFIPPQSDGQIQDDITPPPGKLVYLQYLGDKKNGIIRGGGSMQTMAHEDFFDFMTGTYKGADKVRTTHAKIIDPKEWERDYVDQEVTYRTQESGNMSRSDFQKQIAKVTGKEELETQGISTGTTFSVVENDEKTYFFVENYNPAHGTISLNNGDGTITPPMSTADFIKFLKNWKGKGAKIEHQSNARLDTAACLQILKSSESTKDAFKQVQVKNNVFVIGDTAAEKTSDYDPLREVNIFKLKPGAHKHADGDDVYVKGIDANGMATVSFGTFTQAKVKYKDGKTKLPFPKGFKEASWKGSPAQKVHISTLTGFLESRGHEPETIVEDVNYDEWQNEKEKPSILAGIMAIRNIAAIPEIFKKPFEAWKEDDAMLQEVSANQAAFLFVSSIPGLKHLDWVDTLRGNTSRNIKDTVDKIATSIGDCYSELRAELIYKYATRYNHPHPKFIGALMATMAEYGQLYYKKNAEIMTPWFWYCKIRGIDPKNYKDLVKDKFFQTEAKKQFYGADNFGNMPDLTWEQIQELNEIEMLHSAFVVSQKQFPQYSNFFRMFDKYKNKGAEAIKNENGPSNLHSRNTMDRLEWMIESIQKGRITEMAGSLELWLEQEHYEAHFHQEPIYALFLSNKLQQAPLEITNKLQGMTKDKSVLCPAFFFINSPAELELYKKATVEIAYIIGKDAGDELARIIEAFGSKEKHNEIGGPMKDFRKWWASYGQEMIDLQSIMKDPRLLLAKQQETGDFPGPPQVVKNAPSTYQGHIGRFVDRITKELGNEDTTAIRSRQYKNDSFRVNSPYGFAPYILDLVNYMDKNFESAFANGTGPTTGDGVWGELMKITKNIPKYAREHAKAMGREGDKDFIDAIAYEYYMQMRNGKTTGNGGIRDFIMGSAIFQENITRAPYWTANAVIFDYAGGAIPKAKKEGFTDWLDKRIRLSNSVMSVYENRDTGEENATTEEVVAHTKDSTDQLLDFHPEETQTHEQAEDSGQEFVFEEQTESGKEGFKKYIMREAYRLSGRNIPKELQKSSGNDAASTEQRRREEEEEEEDFVTRLANR